MPVSLTKVFSDKPGWYRGDFHAHSICSDGALSPRDLNDLAIAHGLDFLSITDHNNIRAFDNFDENLDHMIIPGIEITLREGHFNVFGFKSIADQAQELFHSLMELPKEIRNKQHRDHAELTDLIKQIKEAGLIIVVAHPLLWPWEWRDHDTEIASFDCIELINDPTYKESLVDNPSVRRMWSAWLNAGYRHTGLGGTDFHRLQPNDDPTRIARLDLPLTYVFAQELSVQAILDGICQRHAYVSMGPKIEFQAEVGAQTFQMGEDLGKIQTTVRLFARVEDCTSPAEALLIKNGKIVTKVPVRDGKAEIEWQVEPGEGIEGSWYRFDVIDLEDQGLAISNPVFFGKLPSPGSHPFGKFLGGFAKA
jgi:hypothetical protein